MAKLKPTPELIAAIVERVPEGFIHQNLLRRHLRFFGKKNTTVSITEGEAGNGVVGKFSSYYFDTHRCTPEQVRTMQVWCLPDFPAMTKDGILKERPIRERWQERQAQLSQSEAGDYVRVVRDVEQSENGYLPTEQLIQTPQDEQVLQDLIGVGVLACIEDVVYDPLRLGERTVREVVRQQAIQTMLDAVTQYLVAQPAHTAPLITLQKEFGEATMRQVVGMNALNSFTVKMKREPHQAVWIVAKGANTTQAKAVAREAVKIPDEAWQDALTVCGEVLRPQAKEAQTLRSKVVARSYTVGAAAKRLALSIKSIEEAIHDETLTAVNDPEGKLRIPAYQVEEAIQNIEASERIAAYERIPSRDLAIVEGVNYATIRRRLRRMGLKHGDPKWGDLRGRWNLPDNYPDYIEKRNRLVEERTRAREAERERQRLLVEAQREEERRQHQALRQRLLEAFPAWRHDGRIEQHISLHVGPPNSGKTHQSLEALIAAESGWYLAPLRLLAFEIFDRLNQRGVPCNLLTGEEYIPVADAQITAATIEMFNPHDGGDCVVIDEAQMLADTDRGWAWTRALMEAQAPEIHVIAPVTARDLIVKLATEAGIPHTIVEHERLAPIKVADKAWPLETLQPRTILVAFSRRMVLHLKSELEQLKRSVSVVYGALPPEVRRKQADRFANGETEICVATDAVGMGLNLPADYVCFYEVEKYDGETVRLLRPSEVQQIGGRAGRYGYAQAGEVGAIYRRDLAIIRKLFYAEPDSLTHAHVAPIVQDLEMIPGHLAEKLVQWRALDSIPETLRDAIKTTDLDERIELARMLSDEDIEALGLEAAVRLINAPTRQNSRAYWLSCAKSVIGKRQMPLPPAAPRAINNSRDLETTEIAISCADIYMWLNSRREFQMYGGDEDEVRAARGYWSTQIDEALLRKIDTARRCVQCGRRLSRDYRHSVCERCFYGEASF